MPLPESDQGKQQNESLPDNPAAARAALNSHRSLLSFLLKCKVSKRFALPFHRSAVRLVVRPHRFGGVGGVA